MKWLWITALLFLVTGVKSGPPTRKVGDIVDGTITRIDRTVKGDTPPLDEFQFTLKDAPTGVTGKIFLEVYADGMAEEPVEAKDAGQLKTPTFVTDLTQYSERNPTFLIITFDESAGPTTEANADIKSFPNFPVVTDTALLKDPRIAEHEDDRLFRAEGTWGDMHLKTDPLAAQGDITYYSFLKDAAVGNYVPCYEDGIVLVDVCDTELKHDDAICETKDTTVSSAVLAYGSDGNATIKLTFQVTAAAAYETILIPQPPQGNVLCTDATCIIKWSDPSSAVLQLIIIQKTTGQDPNPDTWVTSTFDIHDRALVVTKLGTNIIEGRWNILEVDDPNNDGIQEDPHYQMILKEFISRDTVSPISVDCSHLVESKLCFGYFPGVGGGNYTLTVVPENGTALLDQIESNQVTIGSSRPELEILSRHTTTQQNQQRADVQICFQHRTPTEGRSFSHYEMLIINEKGQWLKHSLMQEEEEGGDASGERLCFTPFTINTTDFALTEATRVVVSQRAVDGISVLASGESALF